MRRAISAADGWRLTELELRRWLADQLGVEEESILPSASLADAFAVDSLDMAAMFAAFEVEFGLELDGASCRTVSTFGDLLALVRERATPGGVPLVPFVRTIVSSRRTDAGTGLERVGWLTPYLVGVVADDARAAGRGARLDVTVTECATSGVIGRVEQYFQGLVRRGVGVHVHAGR